MQLEITLLCDNQLNEAEPILKAEHGFAAWLQAPDFALLFDTGSGETLRHNAKQLAIPLADSQLLVLSHGHYDHTGGISDFYQSGADCPVLAHPDIAKTRYSCHKDRPIRSIGISQESLSRINAQPEEQQHRQTQGQMLKAYLGSTGEIPRTDPFEDTGGPFFLDHSQKNSDMVQDDQALWLNSPDGLVILAGCCHSGIINTICHIQNLTGIKKVAGIIGGLHLLHASEARLQHTVNFLKVCAPNFIHLSHCSGKAAYPLFSTQLPDTKVTTSFVGAKYQIELQKTN